MTINCMQMMHSGGYGPNPEFTRTEAESTCNNSNHHRWGLHPFTQKHVAMPSTNAKHVVHFGFLSRRKSGGCTKMKVGCMTSGNKAVMSSRCIEVWAFVRVVLTGGSKQCTICRLCVCHKQLNHKHNTMGCVESFVLFVAGLLCRVGPHHNDPAKTR